MKINSRYCLLTNDVETTSIWINRLRDETGERVLKEGMPLLLELYQKYQIKSTFFFTGYIARLYPEVVKMVLPYRHEIGSHGLSHEKKDGFDTLSYDRQVWHLKKSKELLEDISGKPVIAFRSPALRMQPNSARALIQAGYQIDSSVASQRSDLFFSFGSRQKINWLFAPRLPYRVRTDNLFKKGDSPLVEIPLSATLFPYIGTTMRIFPFLTALQRRALNVENRFKKKPIVFDIHPNELIDESNESRNIHRRSSNFIQFFIQDYLRTKLKVKNLGIEALHLYDKEINYFSTRKYIFTTLSDYVQNTGLL